MNDLERIKHIETKLRFKLNKVSLENLFTENSFLAISNFWQYSLFDRLDPKFYYKGVRNFSLDENGNVTGLALDFCGLFVLEDNYLANFKHLKKLKLRNSYQTDHTFLHELKELQELDLSGNNLSNVEFLKDLTGLTSLDLRNNNLSNVEFLKDLTGLTSLSLSSNNLSNVEFLKDLTGLTSLDLSRNNLSNVEFLKDLTGLTSLSLSSNNLSNVEFLKDLTGLTSLDLRNNNLSNVEFLKDLTGLTSLSLSSNKLSNVEFLKDLTGLTSLDLSYNNLSNVEFLKDLTGLASLDLSNTNLSNVEFLKDLTGLTSLDLSYNNLSNVEFLKDLTGLTSLSLRNNNLSNFEFLKDLTGLTSLDLSYNNLSNVEFLKDLTGLTSLDLSNTKLSNVEFLKDLTGLTSLDLSYTNLSNVEFLKDLTGLTSLSLSNNNLSNVEFLKDLTGLTSLDLSYTNLSNVEFLKDLTGLASLSLYGNLDLDLPPNLKNMIENKGEYSSLDRDEINQIVRYFELLEEQGKEYIYEARALIVGEPGAGKTTLFKKLQNNSFNPEIATKQQKLSTVGIDIDKNWAFPHIKDKTKTFTAHLWDFGGQKIQYILHQYFLTERSLYILLADDRKQKENFNYWFEVIATLGKDCPVLVVLNERNHQGITNFSLKKYREQFADKINDIEKASVDFSNDTDDRFINLQNKIQTKLSGLKHIGQALPAKWKLIRESLEKESQTNAHIPLEHYYEICQQNNLPRKDDQDYLLRYLHDLGIALNYQGDENLGNIVILNPNWVIDALYSVLKDSKIQDRKGKFSRDFIYTVWEKEGYSKEDCQILLNLMLKGKFEIAYKLKDVFQYIVPILLPEEIEEYNFQHENLLEVYLKYNFLPPGILSRLIVRLNESIAEQHNKQIVWQKGVLLTYKNSTAEIIEDEFDEEIRIKVSGANVIENKEFITILRNELYKIHKDWFDNNLTINEFVPCICEVCKDLKKGKQFYNLKVELEKRLLDNQPTIQCNNSYEFLNVRELLEGVYIEDKNIDFGERNFEGKRNFDERGNQNIFRIANLGQSVNQPQDNVSINQLNNPNNDLPVKEKSEIIRVRSLQLQNIGVFDNEFIEFKESAKRDHAEIHILTGENGTGKTTILMALADSFEFKSEPRELHNNLIERFNFEASDNSECRFRTEFDSGDYLEIVGYKTKKLADTSASNSKIFNNLEETSILKYGVFAYSSYRYIKNAQISAINEPEDFNPLFRSLEFNKDYEQSNQLSINQLITNNLSKQGIESSRNKQKAERFANVINSIEQVISDVTDWKVKFDIETSPTKLIVKINGKDLNINTLPDGLRSLISWVADLLCRIDLIAWEDDELPITEKNLVLLLDEIEVHLHPKWQRKVLPAIQKLFTNSQIFVSTHSPFVVNSIDDAWVYDLELDEHGKARPVKITKSSTSQSVETVLRKIFDVDEKFGFETQKKLAEFYEYKDKILKKETVVKKDFLKLAESLALKNANNGDSMLRNIILSELKQISRITKETYEI